MASQMYLEIGVYKEETKIKWVRKGESLNKIPDISSSLSGFKKVTWGQSEKVAICKPGRETFPETESASIWDF